MPTRTFRLPTPRTERTASLVLGGGAAFAIFVVMALAQVMSEAEAPRKELEETLVAFAPPEIEKLEDEPPPPPEEEEPPPELESEPPQLSLDQLAIALDPGTGGALVGDFSMPAIGSSQEALGTEDFVDFSDLDQVPRPLPGTRLDFPARLKRRKVSGRVVLLIRLSERGEVIDVSVDSSTLPEFSDFVAGEVADWEFTPPTQGGQPVRAQARLPIPINIQ